MSLRRSQESGNCKQYTAQSNRHCVSPVLPAFGLSSFLFHKTEKLETLFLILQLIQFLFRLALFFRNRLQLLSLLLLSTRLLLLLLLLLT